MSAAAAFGGSTFLEQKDSPTRSAPLNRQATVEQGQDGSPRKVEGLRCLSCTGPTDERGDEAVCLRCGASFPVTPAGVIEATVVRDDFVHGLDRAIEALIPIFEGLEAPACTERVITAYAESAGVQVGNPVWEGRADVARLIDGAGGVAVDVGTGFGTIAVALARTAAHVYALDKSPGRARATAARARAEGLTNITAVHADGATLPLGSDSCDLALLVGVLEWTGLGQDDPMASQKAVLAEVARVLKPGGTLLIGIENRFGAHYFLGKREEHTRLRFSSLLPRPLAHAYCRLAQGRRLTIYTHSRRALVRLVRSAGLEPRIGVALPSYSEPQLSFDGEDFDRAWRFYLQHVFRYSSTSRRVVGAVARLLPARLFALFVPTFWLAASKGTRPARIPTVVAGSGDCGADIKVVDWEAGHVLRFARRSGRLQERVPLIEGWSARDWISSPILPRKRLRRERALLERATTLIGARERRPATDDVRATSLGEAFTGLDQIGPELTEEARAWCREQLARLSSAELEMVLEHSDFVTVNLVVEAATTTLRDIDGRRSPVFGLPGLDSVILATDLLCVSRGLKQRDLDVALREIARIPAEVSQSLGRLLWTDLGPGTSIGLAVASTVGAVLRYTTNNELLPGTAAFLERSATGELEHALRRLHHGLPREDEPLRAEPAARLRGALRALRHSIGKL